MPYSGRALPITHDFRAARWFTRKGLELIGLAGRLCVDEMVAAVAGLTNADILKDPVAASDEFVRLFAEEEAPLTGYTRPVQLIHGTADTLPAVFSEITTGELAGAGVDATYTPVDGADHFTLLPAVAADVVTRADAFFANPWEIAGDVFADHPAAVERAERLGSPGEGLRSAPPHWHRDRAPADIPAATMPLIATFGEAGQALPHRIPEVRRSVAVSGRCGSWCTSSFQAVP